MNKLASLFSCLFFLLANVTHSHEVSFVHEHDKGSDEIVLISEQEWLQSLPHDYKQLWAAPKTNSYPKVSPPGEYDSKRLDPKSTDSNYIPWSETFISSLDLRNNIGVQVIAAAAGKYAISTRLIPAVYADHPVALAIMRKIAAKSSGEVEIRLISECLSPSLLALHKQALSLDLQVRSVDTNQAFTNDGRTVFLSYESVGFTPEEILLIRKEAAFLKSIAAPAHIASATLQHIYMTKVLASGSQLRIGVRDHMHPDFAAQIAVRDRLYAPLPESDGRIQTLNNMGGMTPVIDAASRAFIEHCVRYKGPYRQALEIGTSYGLVAEEIRRRGGMHLVANDMDYRHLAIFARKLQALSPDSLKLLTLVPGRFPDALSWAANRMRAQFFDAILAARVFHFMAPEEFEESVNAVYNLLDTGGVFFAVMLTPYVRAYYDRFMPVFKERLMRGDPYPGYVTNLADYADPELIPPSEQKRTGLAQPFHFFDEESARRVLERVGFVDITIRYAPLPYKSRLWGMPELGKENLLVQAYKPVA